MHLVKIFMVNVNIPVPWKLTSRGVVKITVFHQRCLINPTINPTISHLDLLKVDGVFKTCFVLFSPKKNFGEEKINSTQFDLRYFFWDKSVGVKKLVPKA